MRLHKVRRSSGFTLVEIMIVVAIIGIIIAIAVPAFLRARENARGQACQENLTKIDGAKEQYALEFRVQNGAAVAITDLTAPGGSGAGQGYLKAEPTCPGGGTYMLDVIGAPPQCTVADSTGFVPHMLPNTSGPGAPPPPTDGGPGAPPPGGPV